MCYVIQDHTPHFVNMKFNRHNHATCLLVNDKGPWLYAPVSGDNISVCFDSLHFCLV